jgi:hypothetical protein
VASCVPGIVKTFAVCADALSQPPTRPTLYKGYRFPQEIISRRVSLYYRFGVSLREVSAETPVRGGREPLQRLPPHGANNLTTPLAGCIC